MVEHHDTVAPELSVLLLVFFSLLVVALVAADALQRRSCWPPAAASVLLVGAAAGYGLRTAAQHGAGTATAAGTAAAGASSGGDDHITPHIELHPAIFMNAMLPPIIFWSGYSMQSRHLFASLHRILALAFGGTFLSTCAVGALAYYGPALSVSLTGPPPPVTAAECLAFGALISATDPVSTLAVLNTTWRLSSPPSSPPQQLRRDMPLSR